MAKSMTRKEREHGYTMALLRAELAATFTYEEVHWMAEHPAEVRVLIDKLSKTPREVERTKPEDPSHPLTMDAAIDRAAKITDRRQALAGLQTLGRPIAAELRQSSRKEGELLESFAAGGPFVKRGPRRGDPVSPAWRRRLVRELRGLTGRNAMLFLCDCRIDRKMEELGAFDPPPGAKVIPMRRRTTA
jgi:hypothetical protein